MDEAQNLADSVRASEAAKDNDENELCRRFAFAVSVMDSPKMSGVNPMFKSRYSTLQDLIHTVQEPCGEFEIAWGFRNTDKGLIAWARYRSAEWTSGEPIPPFGGKGNEAHVYGSSQTYQKRYALMQLFPIAGDPDDDGNAAGGATEGVRKAVAAKRQGTPPEVLSELKEAAAAWHPSFEQYPVFAEFCSQIVKAMPEFLKDEQITKLRGIFAGDPPSPEQDEFIGKIETALERPF
jgi:hypothetical protein